MNNIIIIGTIFLIVLLLILMLQTKYKAQASDMLLYLVVNAETMFGAGTGVLKYSAVSTWLYEKLPSLAKLLITRKQIDKMIEFAVERMKEYLKNVEAKKTTIENKSEQEGEQ